MRVLVTGAAGFIGRWVVGELLARGHEVLPVDNLVAGDADNLAEFAGASGPPPARGRRRPRRGRLPALARRGRRGRPPGRLDLRPGLDRRPGRRRSTTTSSARSGCSRPPAPASARFLFMSTCMVYDRAETARRDRRGRTRPSRRRRTRRRSWPARRSRCRTDTRTACRRRSSARSTRTARSSARSARAGSWRSSRGARCSARTCASTATARRRATCSTSSDCARFVVRRARSPTRPRGRILNAGTGVDVSVNELAAADRAGRRSRIVHVEHIHPQSEIAVLRCDATARRRAARLARRGSPSPRAGHARATWMAERSAGRAGRCPVAMSARRRSRIDGGDAGPHDVPAVRPPADRRRRHRRGRRGAPLGLADDGSTGPGLRGGAGGRDGRTTRGRVLVGDGRAPRRDRGGRPRAGRRGDHDAR